MIDPFNEDNISVPIGLICCFLFVNDQYHSVSIICKFCLKQLINSLVTVNSEIFLRILFSRVALKDIFATVKIRDLGMIHLYQ